MPNRPSANPTPITPPRVSLIDPRTGLVDRAWYMFFLSLFNAAQIAIDNDNMGPSAVSLAASLEEALNRVNQELQTQPVSVVEQVMPLLDSIAQRLDTLPRPELGTFSGLQQANLPWTTFTVSPDIVPPDVGTLAWDGGTTLGVQMTANVLGRVNESGYYYIKASAAITKGQVVMFTGAVGASGVPTGAPATGVTDGSYIMGIAAESLLLNDFGLVQFIGTLRGVNTSAYADGDILWYDPAVTGGLTKTKPVAPNVKVQMAAVISAANNGTILIRVSAGSELGGTDSNVQFGTLTDKDLIQYDSALKYWKNVSPSSITVGKADTIKITDDVATATVVYPVWSPANNGYQSATVSSTKLTFVPSTARLGINTASPQTYLHIVGEDGAVASFPTLGKESQVIENNGNCGLSLITKTTGNAGIKFVKSGATTYQGYINYVMSSDAFQYSASSYHEFLIGSTFAVRIESSGNVGIGTSSPATKLEVNGVIALTDQTTSSAQFRAVNTGGTFYHGLDTSTGASFGAAYAAALWHSGNYPMLFATNNLERMRISAGGLIGIGSDPTGTSKLQIFGPDDSASIRINRYSNDATPGGLVISKTRGTTPNATTTVNSGDQVGTIVFQESNGTTYGNTAGITSVADGAPGVGSFPGALVFATTASGASTATERARFDKSGNLGIGTQTPGARVDIASGNLLFSSTAQRITGDTLNATIANRLGFQNSTANTNTVLSVFPNGTGTITNIDLWTDSNPVNTSYFRVRSTTAEATLQAERAGTGTYLPMTFQTSGTEKLRIAADTTGTYTFGGTAPRITGDMSNATLSNRVLFQSSTTNSATSIGAIPNGTGTISQLLLSGASDINNASLFVANAIGTSEIRLASTLAGTGTYLPMTFYTSGTEKLKISADTTGTYTFGGTAPRITGDMTSTGASVGNRITFQTSTTNGGTTVSTIPNGTGTVSGFRSYNGSDPANSSYIDWYTTTTEVTFRSAYLGTGTYLPMTFSTGGSERVRIDTSGNVGIGTASPVAGYRLNVVNDSGNAQQLIRAGTNFNSTIAFGDQDSSTSGQLLYAHNGDYMRFDTAGSPRMHIDSSGLVGIGAAPATTSKLQIFGPDDSASIRVNRYSNDTTPGGLVISKTRGTTANATTTVNNGDQVGTIVFQAANGTTYGNTAGITSIADGAPGAGSTPGALIFATTPSGSATATERMRVDTGGNVYAASGATGMTNGFFYIPAAGGAPTGTPTAVSGRVPMYYDTTNNKFYVYNGAWKSVALA